MKNWFQKLRGRWRLRWSLCPECNSDGPEKDTCPVCSPVPQHFFPMSDTTKEQYWKRFLMARCVHGRCMEDKCPECSLWKVRYFPW